MSLKGVAIRKAFEAAKLAEGETLAVSTPDGREVHFASLAVFDGDEGTYVEVRLTGVPVGGDASFRIVNPPLLVPDPMGSSIIRGQRFRFDPITAIAMVISQSGGAAQKARRRRR